MRSILLALFAVALCAAEAKAQATFQWNNPAGGLFSDSPNWTPNGVPGPMHVATFDLVNTFNVGFNAGQQTAELSVLDGDVTFQPVAGGAHSYIVGTEANVVNGTLSLRGNEIGADSFQLLLFGPSGGANRTMFVGGGAGGQVNVFDGVRLEVQDDLSIGNDPVAGNGAVVVDGSTARVTLGSTGASSRGRVLAGATGQGQITVQNGGSVTGKAVLVGFGANAVGTATVTGASSLWTTTGQLFVVGEFGSGLVNLADGGQLVTNGAFVGGRDGGTGTVDIFNATWDNSGSLMNIGDGGQGTLTIRNNAMATSDSVTIGNQATGMGEARVSGFNAQLTSNSLAIGNEGEGRLLITNDGDVGSVEAVIGAAPGGSGRASVIGGGSSWDISAELRVGHLSSGELAIVERGTVKSRIGTIGSGPTGEGSVGVEDEDSLWTTGELNIGTSGGGQLTIGPGGSVFVEPDAGGSGVEPVDGTTTVGPSGGILLVGGTLLTEQLIDAGGDFFWTSGFLALNGPAGLSIGAGPFMFAEPVVFLNPNQTLVVTHQLRIEDGSQLIATGDGLITGSTLVEAAGLMFLTAGQQQFGAGLTNHGSVVLNNTTVVSPVTSPAGSDITVLGNVTFEGLVSGAGGFFGPGTAIFNGGHSPGDSPAVVPVEGNLSYGSSNTLTVEIAGMLTGEFDRLEVQGDVMLDGSLVVDILSGFLPSFGDEFEILNVDGNLTGQFAGFGEGALLTAQGGELFRITYTGGDGNDVVLTAVPEPGTMVLALLSVICMMAAPRRRKPV